MKSERNNLFNSSQSWRHLLCFVLSNRKSPPEGTVNQLWPKNRQNYQILHYWRSPRDSKGTKMSGRNHTIRIFKFLVQPRGFRVARGQKPRKFRLFWWLLALFGRNSACSSSKTMWLHQKPKNSNCVVFFRHFGTLAVPGAASIVEISILK